MPINSVKIFDNFKTNAPAISTVVTKPADKSISSISKSKIVCSTVAAVAVASLASAIIIKKCATDKRYISNLAKALSSELKQKIKPFQLSSVMAPKEFIREISKLKEQNFVASAENIRKGIFLADLHSHTNFSDGLLNVSDLLTQAAEYGDKLNKINGKKFIFALSDHDGINGVKEALKIIAQNPEKFKNIKFVAASELSFPLKCSPQSAKFQQNGNKVEFAEVLAYCINPFSKRTTEFFSNLYKKREIGVNQTIKSIQDAFKDCKFSTDEYYKFFAKHENKYFMHNQHWRLFNYLNMKYRINQIAQKTNENPEILFEKIMGEISPFEQHPYALEQLLIKKNMVNGTERLNSKLCEIITNNHFPTIKNNSVEAMYDNTFYDIANYVQKENLVLGFAHPAFTILNFNPNTAAKDLYGFVKQANGRLLCAEKFHQAYPIPRAISEEQLIDCNKILDQLHLIPIGGRDNHTLDFTKFANL